MDYLIEMVENELKWQYVKFIHSSQVCVFKKPDATYVQLTMEEMENLIA